MSAQSVPTESFHQRHEREVAERVIRMLESGVGPFVQPWDAATDLGLPMNPTTGKSYRGSNMLHLWSLQEERDLRDNRWLTCKQSNASGARVRRGEKSSLVKYWDWSAVEEAKKTGDAALIEQARPRAFYAHVFNATQIDGLPELERPGLRPEHEIHAACEQVIRNSGAIVLHDGGSRAYYQPSSDTIHLPPRDAFHSQSALYAVALHELAHWSGYPTRLKRNLSGAFGSLDYAREELVAEISSMTMGERLSVGHDPTQHAAYIKSWLRLLRDDPKEIFRAAAAAERVVEFLKVPELVRVPMARVEKAQEAVVADQQELEKTSPAHAPRKHRNRSRLRALESEMTI
ncbi:ArdC family protein [Luteimonas fraxinea]|uniref:SsDNA-binding domain-containing protein n=1 Tax=Luteimonas fraxinea TaxID=2901869 RepID=A0ABS8UCT1_9GAMM|nr:zincin-like metallopeptidase domain-containing protein [Luteimonas fraxinea]MCD9096695.1 ssDNA-binding domain-containing protein [Luteimonas fraxinea]MCD9126064.1 ssDNA-binding domain-containing protein [Luteimonas fraxinea]